MLTRRTSGHLVAVLLSAALGGCALGPWHVADVNTTVKTERKNETRESHTMVSAERLGQGLELGVSEQVHCSGELSRLRRKVIREERDATAMAVVVPVLFLASVVAPFFYEGKGFEDNGKADQGEVLTWIFVSIPLGVLTIVERFRQTERTARSEQALGSHAYGPEVCETTATAGVELELRLSDGTLRKVRTGADGYAHLQVEPELVVDVYVDGKPLRRIDIASPPESAGEGAP